MCRWSREEQSARLGRLVFKFDAFGDDKPIEMGDQFFGLPWRTQQNQLLGLGEHDDMPSNFPLMVRDECFSPMAYGELLDVRGAEGVKKCHAIGAAERELCANALLVAVVTAVTLEDSVSQ